MKFGKRLRIAAVEYLNTKPFLYGIELAGLTDDVEVILEHPANCAKLFEKSEVDVALIPTGALGNLSAYKMISNYCIACNGPVGTVALFSQQPIDQLDRIYLDYQSRSSRILLQWLFKNYWKREVEFLDADRGYEERIRNAIGGLIIGDRAIKLSDTFAFKYDLGDIWKKATGLPFVFAVWVASKKLNAYWEEKLNMAFEKGLQAIPEVSHLWMNNGFDVNNYFTDFIHFTFDRTKKQGLDLFLSIASSPLN